MGEGWAFLEKTIDITISIMADWNQRVGCRATATSHGHAPTVSITHSMIFHFTLDMGAVTFEGELVPDMVSELSNK